MADIVDKSIANFSELLHRYYRGEFKVNLSALLPHPAQRLLDRSSARELAKKICDSDQRSQHPLLGILHEGKDIPDDYDTTPRLVDASSNTYDLPWLPDGLSVRVFSGQHRIEALRLLDLTGEENYWPVKVYHARTAKSILLHYDI